MSSDERNLLLEKIEEIWTNIERIQPEVNKAANWVCDEDHRTMLAAPRKDLARDMELLHADSD